MKILPILITLCIGFFLSSAICAQDNVVFSGNITDTEGKNLEGANIILYPSDPEQSPSFGVSSANGTFNIKVVPNIKYTLNITFIGFVPVKEPLSAANTNFSKDFVLTESLHELEEVVLNYTPPIEVKKDTTTFQTDAFVNGKERKLGAVLKKLPGVSVNRDGEVFFKDKKVEAVLVENKTFFNGQPKMATQNIPADVVSEVQMIEDYNETAFLKDFESTDNLVMNIILKEGKKKFFFGDIESAIGYQDRYRFHPSIFRYTPTTIHNFIGDINNTQSRSFSLSDYLKIEGENSPESIIEGLNSPTAKFLQNEDYFKNEHLFGGYNFQYNPNIKNELRIFTLGMLDKSFREDRFSYTYQPSQAFERRVQDQNDRNAVFFGKVKYKFTPDLYTVLKLNMSYNRSQLNNQGSNFSELQGEEREYGKENRLTSDRLQLNISADKWFSSDNVSTAKVNALFNKESLFDLWESGSNIFSSQIPLLPSTNFSVNSLGNRKFTDINFDLKHHYRPFRTNMISIGLSGKIYKNSIENTASQVNDDNTSLNLQNFENDFSSLLTEINNSITHKWYIGKEVIFDVGLVLQNIQWKDIQSSQTSDFNDTRILPIGKLEWNFDEKKSIKLSYNEKTTNPDPVSRLAGSTITDFNRVVTGNSFLEQSTNHRGLLSLSLFKTYGLSFYSKIGFRKNVDPIVQSISFEGIDGTISPFQLNKNITSYDITLRPRYNRRYWKLSLETGLYLREGISVFNEQERFNNSLNINNTLAFITNFEEAPNIEFEVKNSFLEYKNPLFTNITLSTDVDFSVVYDYKNWKFDFSMYQNFYNNRSQRNTSYFNLIETKIFYRKEDSPIEVGLDIYNLGNNVRQISNQYNTVFFAENSKRLFPKTIMLNINYKL